jgi:hypothetical protein
VAHDAGVRGEGDRVARVKNVRQSSPPENGVWIVTDCAWGKQDPVWKLAGLEEPISHIRRTGKGSTTAMLCKAVDQARTTGLPVYLVAWSISYRDDLVRIARDIAVKVGIDPELIQPGPARENMERWSYGRSGSVFNDHFWPIYSGR